ncbi:hypothetical protein [Gemmatimonas sp.]|uniref:hypothetical protein n=1 Tax=Gemmatimonas sp. TaxID=1962908 RepID=UPI00286D7D46|nr:hypothetical protein [Gemmatimonas sp.]
MPRPFRFRLIALVVALLGGFAAPASAVTHGWLHDHVAHERADHHGDVASEEPPVEHGTTSHGAELEESENHHRHGHRSVDVGPASRDGMRLAVVADAAVTTMRVEIPDAIVVAVPSVAFANRNRLAGPDPGGTSPPSLRAPPVR